MFCRLLHASAQETSAGDCCQRVKVSCRSLTNICILGTECGSSNASGGSSITQLTDKASLPLEESKLRRCTAPDGPTAAPSHGLTVWQAASYSQRRPVHILFIVLFKINKEWKAPDELAAGSSSFHTNVNDGEGSESQFLFNTGECLCPFMTGFQLGKRSSVQRLSVCHREETFTMSASWFCDQEFLGVHKNNYWPISRHLWTILVKFTEHIRIYVQYM